METILICVSGEVFLPNISLNHIQLYNRGGFRAKANKSYFTNEAELYQKKMTIVIRAR